MSLGGEKNGFFITIGTMPKQVLSFCMSKGICLKLSPGRQRNFQD